ncbi:MAG: NlpC/P60 family protein [Sutterella sp.]
MGFSASLLCRHALKAALAVSVMTLAGCAFRSENPAGADGVLLGICRQTVPDTRTEVCEIRIEKPAEGKGEERILITTDSNAARLALEAKARVRLLPDDGALKTPWALVRVPIAEFKTKPAFSSVQTTQAVMGTPLQLLETVSGWHRVRLPEGYIAWVRGNQIVRLSDEAMFRFSTKPKLIVTVPEAAMSDEAGRPAGLLPAGSAVLSADLSGGLFTAVLPDGRRVRLRESDVGDINRFRHENAVLRGKGREAFSQAITETARSLTGRSYLWGGATPAGADCSGFVSLVFRMHDIILPRDSDQMAGIGEREEGPDAWKRAEAGDLLFFGRKQGPDFASRVSHVGIALGNGRFIHSLGDVHEASFIESDPDYDAYERNRFIGRVRLDPADFDNPCITTTGSNRFYGVPPAAPERCRLKR